MRASAVRRFQGEATLNYVHKSRGVCRSAIKRTLEPHGKPQPLEDCSVDVTLSTEVSLPASSAPGAEGHGADFHWLVPPLRVGPHCPSSKGGRSATGRPAWARGPLGQTSLRQKRLPAEHPPDSAVHLNFNLITHDYFVNFWSQFKRTF